MIVVGLAFVAFRYWPQQLIENTPASAIRFTDVTASAGISFRHVNGATGKKLLPETMGAGVAVIDFDRDGRPDLFFVNGRPWPGQPDRLAGKATQALYRNRGDGTFEDVTAAVGLDVELFGMGVAVGDFDNDGWPDLFVTAVGGNRLFRNVGGKRVRGRDRAARAAASRDVADGISCDEFLKHAEPIPFPSSAAFLDYDGDGRLDLFVCNYLTWSPAVDLGVQATPARRRAGLRAAAAVPRRAVRPLPQRRRQTVRGRLRPRRRPRRVDCGPNAPQPVGKALGVVVCDPDGDGWPDLVVANDTVRNFFFHNVPAPGGGRRFEEIGLFAGVAYADGRPARRHGHRRRARSAPDARRSLVANFTNEPNSLFQLHADEAAAASRDVAAKSGWPARAASR